MILSKEKILRYFSGIFFLLLLFSTFLSNSVFGVEKPGLKIGVVDLVTATVLHPRMSLFDFGNNGFYRVPVGLPGPQFQTQLALARVIPEEKKLLLQKELKNLELEAEKVESERKNVLQTSDEKLPETALQRDQKLWTLFAKQKDIRQKQLELTFQIENPEVTTPNETIDILHQIEEETFQAIEEIAASSGCDLVLNQSVPPPGPWPDQADKFYLLRARATWLDSGLYFAFLANGDLSRQDRSNPYGDNPQMQTYLELIRHPTALSQLPIRPHPLVLKGGIDLTPEVVANLLKKYSFSDSNVQRLIEFLKSQKEQFEADIR